VIFLGRIFFWNLKKNNVLGALGSQVPPSQLTSSPLQARMLVLLYIVVRYCILCELAVDTRVDKIGHKNYKIDKKFNFKPAIQGCFIGTLSISFSLQKTFIASYLDIRSEESMLLEGIMKS